MLYLFTKLQQLSSVTFFNSPGPSAGSFFAKKMETITITPDFLFSLIGSMITAITAVALTLVVWIGKGVIRDLRKLEDEFNRLPIEYVRQSSYNRDLDDIKRLIGRVLDKLDGKADKHD